MSVLYDVIIDDRPLRKIDRDRKVRDGSARKITISGLRLYVELSGWRRTPLHMVKAHNI